MQSARGGIGLVRELGAGVQRGEDHLERRLVLELGVGIDRDAAPVVAHHDPVVGLQLELDAAGVAGHGLVHGVVQKLGDQVVHGRLVAAADIHSRPTAHRLQPLEDLDILGRVARLAVLGFGQVLEQIRHQVRLPFRSSGSGPAWVRGSGRGPRICCSYTMDVGYI